ncbi:BNR repeat-containing protein [Granulosicoccus sp.]|nr:BNR-4 repeat-containing protein [Granulosicoccus sp.]MDB4224437.1 BNR repeat-containing protein [Granulosicoccus sp.]
MNSLYSLKKLCFLFLCTLALDLARAETLYFDGEDGSVGPWEHYVGQESPELLQNIFDEKSLSRVIQIQGVELEQGSVLGGLNAENGWNNSTEFTLNWRMSIDSTYVIEVPIDTLLGKRFLVYQANFPSTILFGRYLYLSLGHDSLKETWMTYARDLSKDLEESEPGNRLLAVNGMIFRGSGRLDEVRLDRSGHATSHSKIQTGSTEQALVSDNLVAEFKVIYGAYSVSELMVLSADGDRYANLELSLRHSRGSRGAPKSQSAALRHYELSAKSGSYSNAVSAGSPIDEYGVPAIRIDRSASMLESVAKPSAVLSLSANQGNAPVTLTANASSSTTYNGASIMAWSDNALGSFSPSRLLGSAHSLTLTYPNVGEYALRLLVMDERGNISSDKQFVSVDIPSVASPPVSVVLQQDLAGLVNVLSWASAPSSEVFDIRLLSSSGTVLDTVANLLVSTHCDGTGCSLILPAAWVIDDGTSLQVRAYDGLAMSAWVVSAVAPLANAGPDRGHVQGDSITVYGGDSIDADGIIDSYEWRRNGVLLGQSANLTVQLPFGSHTLELAVTDNSGHVSRDQMQVSVFAQNDLLIGSAMGDVVKILDALQVSRSQVNTQMTPIANANGFVYIANIEHGLNGDEDGVTLHTVVRQGRQNTMGVWSWESVLVEDRTVFDEWHTAPSIEVDRDGQVHIVYNMHNIPWQYKRTTEPHDIQSFEFRGQYVSQEQINTWKFDNSTTFPSFGYADIPGTQITYPRFEKDPNGELYIAYRFASRPKRSWPERTFGAGLAEYSRADQVWTAIGEPLDVTLEDYDFHPDAPVTSTPFAAKTGWTVYHPSLVFDNQIGMGVLMLWRSGTAGATTSKPCFAWSDNKLDFETLGGVPLSLPLQPEDCSNLGFADSDSFYNIADSEMDSLGNIYLILDPVGKPSVLLSYKASTGQWQEEESPAGATEIFLDSDDKLWAVASGPTLHMRASISSSWQEVYSNTGSPQCYPRASVSSDGSIAFIHTHNCNRQDISVFAVRLKP